MAKYHGKNAKVYTNGYSISTYLQKISLSMSAENPEDTTIGSSSRGRVPDGIIDGSASMDGIFDDDSGAIDSQMETILGAQDTIWSLLPAGDAALGDVGYGFIGINNEYSSESAYDDVVKFSASTEVSGGQGVEFCKTLVPLAAKTTSSNSANLDNGAATTNGGSAYLQVTAASGLTSIDVTIKGSATGSFGGEETTVGTFTQVTAAPDSERISFSGSVPRYIRAYWTLVGTSATIFVAVHRHNS